MYCYLLIAPCSAQWLCCMPNLYALAACMLPWGTLILAALEAGMLQHLPVSLLLLVCTTICCLAAMIPGSLLLPLWRHKWTGHFQWMNCCFFVSRGLCLNWFNYGWGAASSIATVFFRATSCQGFWRLVTEGESEWHNTIYIYICISMCHPFQTEHIEYCQLGGQGHSGIDIVEDDIRGLLEK